MEMEDVLIWNKLLPVIVIACLPFHSQLLGQVRSV